MPIYTYRCENCGVQFERQQSFNDASLKTCPECRKKALKKVITPTRIIFKGSGFYSTDHKSTSGAGPTKKTEKKEETKIESKMESTTESKTESKAESKSATSESSSE
jgi:putative FmdB family regulatory protein